MQVNGEDNQLREDARMNTTALLEKAGALVWGPWTAAVVMLGGIWLSFRTGFPQLPCRWWRLTAGSLLSRRSKKSGISPFQSATAALAGSLGTGNIIGVAAAITAGGAGAIFWMWMAAIPGMAAAYAENVMGMRCRQLAADGRVIGGPMPYMRRLRGGKLMAALWAGLCSAAALCLGNLVQVNSIAVATDDAWGAPPVIVGAVLCTAAAPAILGGARAVTRMTGILVPFMAAAYILACGAVIAINISELPAALARIVREAFCPQSVSGGMLGAMLTGVRRGVFTNEAGMGTSVLIHCTADTDNPEEQGRWSVFEVFTDTILMCTLTALAILTSGADRTARGAAMSTEAFRCLFGSGAEDFCAAATLLFAFATVIGWSCCGERSFAYLFGEGATLWYRAVYVLLIVPGCVMDTAAVWAASDILNALLMLPNLAAVIMLWSREQTSECRIPSRALAVRSVGKLNIRI